MAAEKQQFIDDQRRRNAVEGKIGQEKRRFGLGLIREKLAVTQGSTIAINVLVMNLEKPPELIFVLFVYWLQLLLDNASGKGSRFGHLSTQESCRMKYQASGYLSSVLRRIGLWLTFSASPN